MKTRLCLAIGLVLLGRLSAAEPLPVVAPAEPPPAAPAVAPVAPPDIAPPPPALDAPEPAELAPDTPPVRPSDNPELRLNFKGAPVDTVLDYLSRAAGFVIVRDAPVTGTVDIVSHNPLTPDEAVALLHGVLNGHGLAVIRTDRVLRIVRRDDARLQDIPVVSGNEPDEVPRTSEIVTQIVSLRHTKAVKLMETLKPLIPTGATMAANEDSNALIVTDTRANIRRMLEIIQAIDATVSNILDIQVISLSYADATETADVINKVYETPSSKASTQSSGGGGRGPGDFFARMRGGPGGEGDAADATDTSVAVRQTATYVKAVADQRGNAVVVTAPAEILPQIVELVTELDMPSEAITTLRVFPLRYADATKLASVIAGLYPDTTTSSSRSRSAGGGPPGFGGMPFGMPGQAQQNSSSTSSQRKVSEAKVLAVADTRTNSVVVSASSTTMEDIAKVVKELDATSANVPVVHVYQLENADVTRTKEILDSMFDDLDSSSTSSSSGSSRRTTTSGSTGSSSGTSSQRSTGSTGSMGSSTR